MPPILCVPAFDPCQVVIERIYGVLRTVVGRAAPAGELGKAQVGQVLIAVRDVRQAEFLLPVDSALDGGIRRIVVLAPVVAASIEMIEQRGREIVVPGEPVHFTLALQIVVVVVIAGESGWSGGTKLQVAAVDAEVARDAVRPKVVR
jgi:hypothetical protein